MASTAKTEVYLQGSIYGVSQTMCLFGYWNSWVVPWSGLRPIVRRHSMSDPYTIAYGRRSRSVQ